MVADQVLPQLLDELAVPVVGGVDVQLELVGVLAQLRSPRSAAVTCSPSASDSEPYIVSDVQSPLKS